MSVVETGVDRSGQVGALVVRTSRRRWERSYVRALVGADAAVAFAAGATAYLVRFGDPLAQDHLQEYLWLSAGLPALWLAAMGVSRAYEARFLSVGVEEFRRVLTAALTVIAIVATASWATNSQIARGYVIIALPMATALTLLTRHLARRIVHRGRRRGYLMSDVLLVGHSCSVAELVGQMRHDPHHGMRVVGACIPGGSQSEELTAVGVRVYGGFDSIDDAVRAGHVDAVAVLTCPEMNGTGLSRLAWSLARGGIDLLVAPALIDVAGPRITIRPVAGLPLLHVDEPQLAGGRRVAKACLDRVAAAAALVLLSPALLAIMLAIRLTSRGPAIFRQTRVGLNGRTFMMWKFRTMVQDAERRRAGLGDFNVDATGHLFKMADDPRVTPVGRWLRRTCLDELPQLVNVFLGQMSLVGPRPLPATDRPYDGDARRRLFVKPGLTGLWQISGRSGLNWEESVRLDLRYVEQWSLALDTVIIWKTLFAVVKRRGAY